MPVRPHGTTNVQCSSGGLLPLDASFPPAFRLSACPSARAPELESHGCRSVPHHRPEQCDHRRTWKAPLCTSMGATMDHASLGANGLMAPRRHIFKTVSGVRLAT